MSCPESVRTKAGPVFAKTGPDSTRSRANSTVSGTKSWGDVDRVLNGSRQIWPGIGRLGRVRPLFADFDPTPGKFYRSKAVMPHNSSENRSGGVISSCVSRLGGHPRAETARDADAQAAAVAGLHGAPGRLGCATADEHDRCGSDDPIATHDLLRTRRARPTATVDKWLRPNSGRIYVMLTGLRGWLDQALGRFGQRWSGFGRLWGELRNNCVQCLGWLVPTRAVLERRPSNRPSNARATPKGRANGAQKALRTLCGLMACAPSTISCGICAPAAPTQLTRKSNPLLTRATTRTASDNVAMCSTPSQ